MPERDLRGALEQLAPQALPLPSWAEVMRRAGARERSRRRRKRVVAMTSAIAVVCVVSYAAYATVGHVFLDDPRVPGIEMHGALEKPDGERVGTLDVKLVGAMLAPGGRGRLWRLRRFRRARQPLFPTNRFPAEWFLKTKIGGKLNAGALYVRPTAAHAGTLAIRLCSPCQSRDGGRLDLSYGQAAALGRAQLVFYGATDGSDRAVTANLRRLAWR